MNKPVMSEGSLIIAGVGGQGVILASNIVCAGYLRHPCRKEGGQVTSSSTAPEGEPHV